MVKYRIYGDGNKEMRWICIAGCFENIYYSKDEAAGILHGEPERCVVDVYDFAPDRRSYEIACRVVVWCFGKYALLANDVLPEEVLPLLYGIVSNKPTLQGVKKDLPLKKHLSAFAPTWQEQISEALGKKEWRVRIYTSLGRVYALEGKKQIEILP